MARAVMVLTLFCYISISKSIKDDIPEECKQYGICDNVENYPTELARKLIAELKTRRTVFNIDEPPEGSTNTMKSGRRSEEDMESDKKSLCKTIKKSWPPRIAHHESGDFKHILNDDVPLQVFNVGVCPQSQPSDDKSTLCRSNTMLMGYEGQCIQKTRLKEMYYIEGNQTVRGYFHIPTCCSCNLKLSE